MKIDVIYSPSCCSVHDFVSSVEIRTILKKTGLSFVFKAIAVNGD